MASNGLKTVGAQKAIPPGKVETEIAIIPEIPKT
jgi:hypothetical protein